MRKVGKREGVDWPLALQDLWSITGGSGGPLADLPNVAQEGCAAPGDEAMHEQLS